MSVTPFCASFMATLDAMRHGTVAAAPAWRVYANTGLLACIDALRANYPSVHRMLGDQAFGQLAGDYVRACPAHDARLFLYGGDLPAWLRRRDGAASPAALAATLDRYWTESHGEADAPPLSMDWIARQSPQAFASLCLRPAPSTRWLALADLALWDGWCAWRQPDAPQPPSNPADQAVLLTRPDDAVRTQAMPLGGAVFLQACEAGMTLPMALQAACDSTPQIEPQALLAALFAAGAFQHPDQFTPRSLP